jgi:hypothetical protein
MNALASVHVFVGPTLPVAQVRREIPTACVHPPVQHGDLLRPHFSSGDAVLIIDGYYHHAGAVRHKEILDLMASGVRVCGSSSMGALRAAELDAYGMTGIGEVFSGYRDAVLTSDDEVALAHTEGPEYRALSMALVSIRRYVAAAVTSGVVTAEQGDALVECARSLPYPARSWSAMKHEAEQHASHLAGAVARVQAFVTANSIADVKATDALLALRAVGSVRPQPGPWWTDDDWRSRYLAEWKAENDGDTIDGYFVSRAAVLRHHQLYDRRFPQRWRRYVLSQIAGSSESTRSRLLEPAALRCAAAAGITPADIGDEWLTPRERRVLTARRAMLTALVRSHRPVDGIQELIRPEAHLLPDDPAAARAVAHAYAVNDEVSAQGVAQHIEHLNRDRLVEHLSSVWRVRRPDPESLTAAARDRGLSSLAEAVEAARPFLLGKLQARHRLGRR